MQTVVDIPDNLYRNSEALAVSRGSTMEQFIVEAVQKEVQAYLSPTSPATDANWVI